MASHRAVYNRRESGLRSSTHAAVRNQLRSRQTGDVRARPLGRAHAQPAEGRRRALPGVEPALGLRDAVASGVARAEGDPTAIDRCFRVLSVAPGVTAAT
jgi:hypothetical protein